MLESFRKRRNSAFIVVAFAAIIIVFIFWGVGPSGNGENDSSVVATVNGEAIPYREYANLYKKEQEYYKETFKEQFTDEMARKLNLKQKAVDILINRVLAIEEAESQGMKVTPEEVQQAISAIPVFSKDGAFDKELYFKVLSSNRIKPAEFEKSVEADLMTAKIREKVIKDVAVTDQELKDRYFEENRKIDLSFVALDASVSGKSVNVTDEEAREYLKKNASDFMVPATINAFYAYAGYENMAAKAKFTEEEIKSYYEANKNRFETQPAVKARHILVRPDPKAADQEKAKADAKKKITDLLPKAKSAKFADLAKAFSQDPGSARQGGDLGWFQKGVMIKAFEEAAFALNKGEVSGVIETEFGFHIIKVEDKKDGGFLPLKEAEPSIKQALAGDKAKAIAREALMTLDAKVAQAKTAEDIKKAASADKALKPALTGMFSEDDMGVELARNEQLRTAAFSLAPGQVGRIVETEEGAYLVRLVERKDAHVPEFAEVASDVKTIIAEEKAGKEAEARARALLERAKKGEDLAVIAKAEKLKMEQSGFFARTEGFMPRTGIFVGDKEALFKLASGAYYPEVVSHNGRHFIFRLSGVKEADEAAFEPRKEELKARLLAEKQDQALSGWLKSLREKAKITINESVL
ncbi:MAG: SurA N-terminal domain-containing protein [Deltaproteobacteria bacterium]|nr:SurA N-terminal domain-containing protein [Deltaproteobacteria bacterium]